jgi:RNA 2',3'-cyclic 3'-phosphodiesterase
MTSTDTWRVFVAINLPIEIRNRLAGHIDRLSKMVPLPQASWSLPENIHLTLKFIGDIPCARVELISSATACAVHDHKPFELRVGRAGVFPKRGTARVLWIGVDNEERKLGMLHSRLEDECSQVGFAREPRPFSPHLTLARLRKPAPALAIAHQKTDFPELKFDVTAVEVIRSELSSAGSRYTTLSRHPLATPS